MLYDNGVMIETLGIERLEQLASEDKIDWPSISEKEIEDRSKGDVFSKGFAVLQTTWFIIQCIARGVAGLNITQLEIATLAFAVLNGILYFLWWDKPQDVACPVHVHLRHPTASDTARLSSKREAGTQIGDPESEHTETPDHDISQILSDPLTTLAGDKESSNDDPLLSATKKMERSIPLESLPPTSFQGHPSASMRFRAHCEIFTSRVALILSSIIDVFFTPMNHMIHCNAIIIVDGKPALSVPTFFAPFTAKKYLPPFIASIATLFGGIHCIAWSFDFPSVVEKHIWRISAVSITAMGPFATVLITVLGYSSVLIHASIDAWVIELITSSFRSVTFFNISVSMMIFCVAYLISRIALLILPLLALRSLPPGSLLDIEWSTYIPHI